MKTSHLFAGAVFVLGCVTGSVVRELVVPARAQAPAPIVFQYTSTTLAWDNNLDGQLNSYGQRGWRLVTVAGPKWIFERVVSLAPQPSYVPSLAPQPSPPAPAPKP